MENDIIRLLPDSVANQIAAGEVIQRPASVVKELVENAVDAGATIIKVIIKDAGRTLIQVVDNGSGMSDTDARLAFERHSTSKIRNANDLFTLSTMGFRGEALASIVAVSQVEMRTMRRGDSLGTRIVINGSKVECQEPEACASGTNMMVKNLFFNVPARRKFLKKDAVELANIVHEFERLALVNPNHELHLIHNDNLLHQLTPGSLKQRVGQLFGKTVERQLLPISTETSLVKISGFVGLPEGTRKRNWLQYFFVNGRNMKHPYFHKAVMNCYEKLIANDVQPNYFINFEVDPTTIDVNIHPTKNEIKFENEQAIWQILEAAIRESLGKFNVAPAIDFSTDEAIDIPAFAQNKPDYLDIGETVAYNPFNDTKIVQHQASSIAHVQSALNAEREKSRGFQDWDKLYTRWKSEDLFKTEQQDSKPEYGTLMQFKNKYILSSARSGLMIIDQHRAHTRVLYEKFLKDITNSRHATQSLIFPEIINLSSSQDIIMSDNLDRLLQLGFDISKAGKCSWAINGLPSIVGAQNPAEVVNSLIDVLAAHGANAPIAEEIEKDIALSMARTAAIKSGSSLTGEDMENLLSDLFSTSSPNYTPDGLLIMKIIDTETLTRSF